MTKISLLCTAPCLALLSGCSEADQCSGFPTKLDEPVARIYALPNAEQNISAVSYAENLIESCYPKSSYAIRGYRMIQRDTKKLNDDEYILTYAFDGISDIRIAFRINGKGRIASVFEVSTL
ncbi:MULTISPECIES: hypothetical protein [Sphingopyxis]|uniref:hypothetical protein n=1 Tax=Sphingopyxis TaxID=165697 RepID=UPI0015CC0950|nr:MULTISPECIES: hypothetical protein [Sphingopyxis]NYF30800.1 hypothetical protein [Sphingopyxis sp. JAI108]